MRHKTLALKWLFEIFCSASAFMSADGDEARNPPLLIQFTVGTHLKYGAKCKQTRFEKFNDKEYFDLKTGKLISS